MGDQITITLPDASTRQLPAGATAGDLAAAIGARLARDAVVAEVDGRLVDLTAALPRDARVAIVTAASARSRLSRNSCSRTIARRSSSVRHAAHNNSILISLIA